MNEIELRREMVRITKQLDELGLNRGTSGNLSARFKEGMLITPSGLGAEQGLFTQHVFAGLERF